jgi:hypothetical protein
LPEDPSCFQISCLNPTTHVIDLRTRQFFNSLATR